MGQFEDWVASKPTRPGTPARPLVTLSYAQSLDGSIARRRGEPLALSGPESLAITHKVRAAHDAVLVGIGTVLSDDPQLTVRHVHGKDPQVIVLDSKLRTPPKARLLAGGRARIFATQPDAQRQTALEAAGAQVEILQGTDRVDLGSLLPSLHKLGITSVMVEGGGEIIRSFIAGGYVDRLVLTTAPVIIDGYRPLDLPLTDLVKLHDPQVEKVGLDTVTWGDLETH